MTITIRPATRTDLPILLELYRDLNPLHTMPTITAGEEIFSTISAQFGREILVAVDGDLVIGTIDYLIMPNLTANGRSMMFLENVVVASTHRRRGIGVQLIKETIEVAKKKDCYKIQVIAAETKEAIAFYKNVGFQAKCIGYRFYL